MNNDYRLTFGKHKGERLADIPVKYLDWVLGEDFDAGLLAKIKAHLETRPEWHALGED